MKLFSEIWPEAAPPLPPDLKVQGLSLDSRKIKPGDLFFALKGAEHSGSDYLKDAHTAGAVAALVESGARQAGLSDFLVAQVPDLKSRLSEMAARFFDHPASQAKITGVTGTNGKTSTCYLAATLFEKLGHLSGYCGTLGIGLPKQLASSELTTPDALEVQRILSQLEALGCSHIFIEASSHGLEQGRLEAVSFSWAVFTNFSRDHLDYHASIQAYWLAKKGLFQRPGLSHILLNAVDPRAAELMALKHCQVLTYGCDKKADISFRNIQPVASGFKLQLASSKQRLDLELKVLGRGYLMSLLAAAGLALIEGYSLPTIAEALKELPQVPGRMQSIVDRGRTIVIDYAHTPEALEGALRDLREHGAQEVFCVFGCGGNRDRGKRPLMGSIASKWSDQVVITNDNPRNEDPGLILHEIESGCNPLAQVEVIPDRQKAIEVALERAKPGDFVLIAGKGHETHQRTGALEVPLNDLDLVLDWQGEVH